MKNVILFFGVLFVISCTKTEAPVTPPPPPVVVIEESIKFSTNLDTGTFNISDTLPLVITVSSKLPNDGIVYSITSTWVDSSKQIFKLDTTLNQSNLSLKIPGHKRMGTYSTA